MTSRLLELAHDDTAGALEGEDELEALWSRLPLLRLSRPSTYVERRTSG